MKYNRENNGVIHLDLNEVEFATIFACIGIQSVIDRMDGGLPRIYAQMASRLYDIAENQFYHKFKEVLKQRAEDARHNDDWQNSITTLDLDYGLSIQLVLKPDLLYSVSLLCNGVLTEIIGNDYPTLDAAKEAAHKFLEE